jgi:ABC-type multidrug transport system ATPase subunit/ABC-type multidrug transport system permease subunit
MTGEVLFDGKASASFVPSYVAQEDSLLGAFTTKETLLYTAALTRPWNIGYDARVEIVKELLHMLGLDGCADTLVGDIFIKGLSGGQRRRLSLGLALLSMPKILLLDEPTSGLDAAAAFEIVKLLKNLAGSKRIAVAATIHQPSTELWNLFDNVCFLTGGEVVYNGPRASSIAYFSKVGYECPSFSNPADFILSLINTDFESHGDVPKLVASFRESELSAASSGQSTENGAIENEKNPNPAIWHIVVLSHRNLLNTVRNPGIILVRLVMYTMLAVMIGAMFLRNGHKSTDKAIQGCVACIFFVFAFMVFMSVAVIPFYMMDRATYFRERFNGEYGVGSLVISQYLSTVPGIFLIALVSSAIVVFMCSWHNFGMFLLLLFLSLVCAESFMAFMSSISPHFIIGIALACGLYGFYMLCEGFFQVRSQIPGWFIWVYYMGFHTYSFRGAVVNEFRDRHSLPDSHQFLVSQHAIQFSDYMCNPPTCC